jgi:hypothetical protein
MNSIEANVDEPIIEHGNEARMSYGDRFEVKFLKEDGAWKLKDLDSPVAPRVAGRCGFEHQWPHQNLADCPKRHSRLAKVRVRGVETTSWGCSRNANGRLR